MQIQSAGPGNRRNGEMLKVSISFKTEVAFRRPVTALACITHSLRSLRDPQKPITQPDKTKLMQKNSILKVRSREKQENEGLNKGNSQL